MIPLPPRSTLFPYTTLFRSLRRLAQPPRHDIVVAAVGNLTSARAVAGVVVGLLRGLLRFRSEEHTSELQSRRDLVCRLLLEKKKKRRYIYFSLQCRL